MIPQEPISSECRTEHDSLGEVRVPRRRYWGAQTERSRLNFPIGRELMPKELIYALAMVKKASAQANLACGVLPAEKVRAIEEVCDEILAGELDDEFPLPVWQTGSGTHTNMNLNEVIANRAHVRAGGSLTDSTRVLHPNDDVNRSQSSNDVFPTAMNVAAHRLISEHTLVKMRVLRDALAEKAEEFMPIVKMGRTHLMDATPLRLGHEFSAYVAQLDQRLAAIEHANRRLAAVALGGTAVGTGLNAPIGFAERAITRLCDLSGLHFVRASNPFAALGSHDDLVEASGALRDAAVCLMKVGNDLRLLCSGPRSGFGELILEPREPGSSIMPGKVNPTQIEALTMVCAQVIGNDATIAVAGMSGQLELNAYKPVLIFNLLMAARNLGDACESFAERGVAGLEANVERISQHVERSLMLVTALSPHLGYEKAARIAQKAHREHTTLREAALALGWVNEDDFDRWVDPARMLGPTG